MLEYKCARVVESEEDRRNFQDGVDGLARWSQDWQLLFNVGKCKIMHFRAKNKNLFKYTMNSQEMEEVDMEKDVRVLVTANMKPSQQHSAAADKANCVLGQLKSQEDPNFHDLKWC